MIEHAVLAALQRGADERYRIDEEGARQIERALASVVARASASDELSRLLQLIVALEGELESPSAARALEAMIRGNPQASALIARRIVRTGALDETRTFKANEGRAEPLIAPAIDGDASADTIKLAEFLDPASTDRIRRRRIASGGAHGRSNRDHHHSEKDTCRRDPAEG